MARRVMRWVRDARIREGRGSVLGPDTSRRVRWWDLTLECGHLVERAARYRGPSARSGGGWHSSPERTVKPAPHRAVCDQCSRDAESGDLPKGSG